MTPATRDHELIGHTADLGLRARAADLPALFEEAAGALAEATADVDATAMEEPSAESGQPIELEAGDLDALAYAWLNELIGLAQARGEALAGTSVATVEEIADGWRLRGSAAFVPYVQGAAGSGARARLEVKSATYHRLAVRPRHGGWEMTAYLDV